MRYFSSGVLLCALLALTGCATPPAPAREGELVATGRVALKAPDSSQMANFTWRDDGQQAALDLGTPLGQTVARLTFSADSARLLDSSGKESVADSAQALLLERTGWSLPVEGMRWWLRGKPDPTTPAQVTPTPEGIHIEQSGWQIDATDLRDAGMQGKLPYRVHASYDGLDLRIVISDWQWQQ